MAIIRELNGHTPKFGKNCFLAENAAVIGDVEMGDDCSIWYGAVLRGDVHYIKIGNKVNIQDNATIHATYQKSPTNIGNNVSIAHNAGCYDGITFNDSVVKNDSSHADQYVIMNRASVPHVYCGQIS